MQMVRTECERCTRSDSYSERSNDYARESERYAAGEMTAIQQASQASFSSNYGCCFC